MTQPGALRMGGLTQSSPAGCVSATATGWQGPQGPLDRQARAAADYRPLQTPTALQQLYCLGSAEGHPVCGSKERGVSMVI